MSGRNDKSSRFSLIKDVEIGEGTVICDQVNLYKCKIGRNCKIDAYVYVEESVEIGDNVKIRPFTFIPTGVKIEDDVLIGPGVMFTNDKYPRVRGKWRLMQTVLKKGCSIGASGIILPGITIGEYSLVGAGSVVTKDVPPYAVVIGNPARIVGYLNDPKLKEKIKTFMEKKPREELKGEEAEWPWP